MPVAVRGREAFRDELFGDAIEIWEGGGLCADVWVADYLREPGRDAVRFEALEESVCRFVPAPCVAAVPDCRAAAPRRLQASMNASIIQSLVPYPTELPSSTGSG